MAPARVCRIITLAPDFDTAATDPKIRLVMRGFLLPEDVAIYTNRANAQTISP